MILIAKWIYPTLFGYLVHVLYHFYCIWILLSLFVSGLMVRRRRMWGWRQTTMPWMLQTKSESYKQVGLLYVAIHDLWDWSFQNFVMMPNYISFVTTLVILLDLLSKSKIVLFECLPWKCIIFSHILHFLFAQCHLCIYL